MFLSIKRYKQDLSTISEALKPSSRQRNLDTELLVPAANVVFLPMIGLWFFSIVLFITLECLGKSAASLGDSFNVLNSLLSGIALGAIALSLFLQRADLTVTLSEMHKTTAAMEEQARHLHFERDMNVREFAATFQAEPLKDARNAAYILRPAFFGSSEFRKALANQWISGEDVDLSKEWVEYIVDSNKKRLTEEEVLAVRHHTWHLSDLIEYYSTLQHHCSSLDPESQRKTARMLGEKYIWAYWRGMLLLLAYEVVLLYEKQISEKERGQFPLPHWLNDLIVFDQWVMPTRYEPNIHPREKGYSGDPIDFEYDSLVKKVDDCQSENSAMPTSELT